MNQAFCKNHEVRSRRRWTPGEHGQIKPPARFWNYFVSHKKLFVAMLSVLWLMLIPAHTEAQTTEDRFPASLPPGVDIRAEVRPEVATIGDSLQIDFDIETPEGYQVRIPEPEAQTGDFAILDFFPGPIVNEADEPPQPESTRTLQHHRARIIAAVYKTGKFVFPPLPIKLQPLDGPEITLLSPPLNIEIQSVLADENPKLKDLKKQADISEPARWMRWLIFALAAALLGILTRKYWKKRRQRPVILSPEEIRNLLDIAEEELQKLLSQGFPENGMVKKFYVLLSEIVKRILEAGYEIHTAEQTTSEIIDSLNRHTAMETQSLKRIESFLSRCDVVKFAKYVPSTDEHETISKDSLQILEEAKKAVGSRQSAVGSEL
jgi:hypothetical protein